MFPREALGQSSLASSASDICVGVCIISSVSNDIIGVPWFSGGGTGMGLDYATCKEKGDNWYMLEMGTSEVG